VADEAAAVEKVLQDCKARAVHVAKDAAEKFKLWEARRMALPVLARIRPTCVLEDATVPRSKIPAMMDALGKITKKYQLKMGTFGHAGDGNLHPTILCDKRDKEEFHRVEQAVDEIFDVALSLGGTLSGEHGIGTAKKHWMDQGVGKGNIRFSRRIRRICDPKSLFNPTKVIGV
jgi:glycolate oxidase